jgi:segregation and condensation protein A
MNPWDVDLTKLTKDYIDTVKQMKEADFKLSGKVVLAAAILLRLKSTRFVEEDLVELDRLISSTEDMSSEEFYEELENLQARPLTPEEATKLIPRTPQPRKRKVSIYDLVNALEQALEVKKRRVMKSIPAGNFAYQPIKMDVGLMVRQVYNKVLTFFKLGKKPIYFHHLLPDEAQKMDKVLTFLPVLQLTTDRKLDLEQKEQFGDIQLFLKKSKKQAEKELGLV